MAIVNQIVTEFLFKGNVDKLEKYQKSLDSSKKKAQEYKKELKSINDFFMKEEKRLKEQLKSLNISDFTSQKTKNLRQSLASIKDSLARESFKDKPDKAIVKKLKEKEYNLKNALAASGAKDKGESARAKDAIKKQIAATDKNRKKAIAQIEEKINIEKEAQETTKEKVTEEKEGMKVAGLALGRFTLALGVASAVIGGLTKAFNYARETVSKHQTGAYGTGMGEDRFTQLVYATSTMTGRNPDEIRKSLSAFAKNLEHAKRHGGAMHDVLGTAGIGIGGNTVDMLEKMQMLWRSGKINENDLATVAGIDDNIFRILDSSMNIRDVLKTTALGATREQNRAKAEELGRLGHQKRNITAMAGGGRMPNNYVNTSPNMYTDFTKNQPEPEITFANALKAAGFGGGGDATITQHYVYNINTNNKDVADKFINDKKVLQSLNIGDRN